MQNVVFYLLGTLFVLAPLVFSPFSSELFEFPKILLIYLVSALIAPFTASVLIHRKNNGFTISRAGGIVVAGIFVFFLSQFASFIYSIDRHVSFFGYYSRFNGGLLSVISYISIACGVYYCIRKDQVMTLLRIILGGAMVVMLWALPSKFGHDLICFVSTRVLSNACWTADFNPAERIFGTLGQPNWMAAFLLVQIALLLFFIFSGKRLIGFLNKKINTLLLLSIFLLSSVELIWTKSRSGLLGFAIIVPVLFTYYLLSEWRHKGKKMYVTSAALIIAILLVLTQLVGLKTDVTQLVQKKASANTVASSAISPSSQIRAVVWEGALKLGKRFPFVGTGVETFAYSYYFTRPASHNGLSEWRFVYNKAHNEFLNFFATTGWIGLGSYILMLLSFAAPIVVYFKHKNKTKHDTLLYLTYLCILTALTVTNFFGFGTTTSNLFLYTFPALMLVYQKRNENNEHIIFAPRGFTLFLVFLWYCLSLLYCANYFFADQFFARSKEYKQTQNSTQAYLSTQQALNLRKEPVYMDQQAVLSAHLGASLRLQKQNKPAGELEKQAELYNALTLKGSPYNIFYLKTTADINYLFSLSYAGDEKKSAQYFNKAIDALKKIEQLAPTDPKAFYTHAALLAESNPEESLVLVKHALVLKPDYDVGLELYNNLTSDSFSSPSSRTSE